MGLLITMQFDEPVPYPERGKEHEQGEDAGDDETDYGDPFGRTDLGDGDDV